MLTDTWNIGWNCLGGGIQYLLPTMIEPLLHHRDKPKVMVGVCLFIRRINGYINVLVADVSARTLRKMKSVKWHEVMGIRQPTAGET